jgi:serine/threonine protein kinase
VVHRAGYVHRDFKPANIVRCGDRVVVADFGLAKLAADPSPADGDDARTALSDMLGATSTLTTTGLVMGTPAYMSPEQFQAQPVDARSDQYAFCVALFEALYGRRPFVGRTRLELAVRMACGEMWEPPANSPVHCEGGLEVLALLKRGLSPDPMLRFASMDELLDQLEGATGRAALTPAGW